MPTLLKDLQLRVGKGGEKFFADVQRNDSVLPPPEEQRGKLDVREAFGDFAEIGRDHPGGRFDHGGSMWGAI